ncbi:hypothetical protein [Amycolatopsis pittospori]|uniref:hypothetical protein n=1 Tax=Amycolatopsis pittospori TaxID=2749434 RepID=UPI0015F080F0|nr:hypothetical protein [Amycolatopsis pittospori]
MIKRVLAGLVTAVVATVAFGTVSAQPAEAIQDPSRKCVWIWTSTGGYCSKLE